MCGIFVVGKAEFVQYLFGYHRRGDVEGGGL